MLIATDNVELAGKMDRHVTLREGQVVELDQAPSLRGAANFLSPQGRVKNPARTMTC
jgi:hypothetical protein